MPECKMKYVYGMRLRGFAPLCQPKDGFVERRNSTTYRDLIVYDRKLTEKEMRDYELDFIASGEVKPWEERRLENDADI